MSPIENENVLDSELIKFCISESLVIIYQYTNVFFILLNSNSGNIYSIESSYNLEQSLIGSIQNDDENY